YENALIAGYGIGAPVMARRRAPRHKDIDPEDCVVTGREVEWNCSEFGFHRRLTCSGIKKRNERIRKGPNPGDRKIRRAVVCGAVLLDCYVPFPIKDQVCARKYCASRAHQVGNRKVDVSESAARRLNRNLKRFVFPSGRTDRYDGFDTRSIGRPHPVQRAWNDPDDRWRTESATTSRSDPNHSKETENAKASHTLFLFSEFSGQSFVSYGPLDFPRSAFSHWTTQRLSPASSNRSVARPWFRPQRSSFPVTIVTRGVTRTCHERSSWTP